ncbi:MAG: diguanylate cyclase [Myxococcota bacterium]|nr:diguanylate cyclase [Myxococcota bacterium]
MTLQDHSQKVLLIDDDQQIHDLVRFHLEDRVGCVIAASDACSGRVLAAKEKPDLILLDICMPDEDGVTLCQKLQTDPATRDIPVVFLTGCDEPDQLVKAFEAGAVDYIRKPICRTELVARVEARLSAKITLDDAREQARLDGLTGLENRVALDECLEERVSEHLKEGFPFSLAILDLDHFKAINDRYGHQMGDEIICSAVRALVRMSRPYDRLFRYGGDEFVVVIAGGDPEDAKTVVSRMLTSVRAIRLPVPDGQVGVTCSAGLVSQPEWGQRLDAKDLLERADRALYEAKGMGRSRLVRYPLD